VKLLTTVLLCGLLNITGVFADWIYRNFDESMQLEQFGDSIQHTYGVVGIDGNVLYAFFKSLYQQYNLSVIMPSKHLKIPKIIHQIWLGSPVPDVFNEYMQSWVAHHCGPDWLYILWDDQKIKDFKLYNQAIYDSSSNFGQKSDIVRWEILYTFGGLYVDVDFECFASFDIFHYAYDFYVGLQPLDSQIVQLNNALVGSCAGHPILKHCIVTIKDDWARYKGAPQTTGPVHFTRSFYLTANKYGTVDIAFPASYFYPLGTTDTIINKEQWIESGAYAVHWWAKTWMPKKYRRPQFRVIENEAAVQTWNN
jgi:mannosyltransferase OCH1-like enzyme